MSDMKALMEKAKNAHIVVPAFNIPYLPMMEAIIDVLRERNAFALIAVARLEWVKFESGSQKAIADEYRRIGDRAHTRLHQDHVPVIDEDDLTVDYLADIGRALELGYDSVMIDASRLPFEENIAATAEVCRIAHDRGVPVEAELGSVMGHEANPSKDYEEIFAKRIGFTDPADAEKFVRRTGVDWLSVAVGSVHGSINPASRGVEKIAARIDIEHLAAIDARTRIPLVLHGGSAIPIDYLKKSFQHGICKLNIAADLRKPYEALVATSPDAALAAVREAMYRCIDSLGIDGSAKSLGLSGT
jgi:ketose-bisphosphate aldolase